ncbi:substrate-binding periplasmic protein [Marinobacter sp.]|uniref:substrate-binding periplasmic protein n=1 Tax=Marinobacter sp. TaxID=50741 RepID=UPI003A951A5C
MKRFLYAFGALLFGASSLTAPVMADSDIRLAVPDITSLLTENQDGVYQQIMRRALEGVGVDVRESFYPYKRAMLVFEQGGADCIYSFTEVLAQRLGEDAITMSFPLGKFSYYLFTLKANKPVSQLERLEGKAVGAVIGHETYLNKVLVNQGIDVIWSKSDAQNVAMLEHQRFSAMIAAVPDIVPFLDKLSYDPEQPLLESYDRLTCHNTEENRAFLSKLSVELKRLKDEGVYEQLAGSLYFEFESGLFATEAPSAQ